MTAHRFVFAQVNAAGTTSIPAGAVSPSKRDGETGKYNVKFSKSFDKAPAVTLISASGTQSHARINQYGKEDRKDHVNVDTHALTLSNKKGEVAWADLSFNLIAALSGGAGVGSLQRLGADTSDLRVVAGVVDGTNAFNVEVNYGGFSLDAKSEKGLYRINFGPGFAETPVVLATIQLHERKVRTVYVTSTDAGSVTLEIRNSDGERAHGNFHFLAIGKATAGHATASGRLVTGAVSRNADETFAGQGFTRSKEGTATYDIDFEESYKFGEVPVVVASTEHMKEEHLRQAQVFDVKKSGFKLDVFGFEDKDSQDYNNSAFHFIAYAPS